MRLGPLHSRRRDIRVMRPVAATLAAFGLLAAGCVHEQVAWPPTRQDIRRINAGADAHGGWLRVEYVEPLATYQGVYVKDPVAIEAVDLDRIAFQTRDGTVQPIPIATVKGVTVKERGTGALIGAGIGLAGSAVVLGLAYLIAELRWHNTWNPSCDTDCRSAVVGSGIVIWPAAIGAVVGYFIRGRRTFDLGGAR